MEDLIDGRYRVLSELGHGVSGDVHLVEDTENGSELALKFLRTESLHLTPAQLLDRFKEEFTILKELKHPHIARIGEFGFDSRLKQHYFTEEFVDGSPLTDAVADATPEQVEEFIVQTLRALEFLHSHQIFHFDLKPANLLLTKETKQIKVIDFGLANIPGQSISGTPTYMAPEICLQQARDGRADLYALGVIWYQCLTGQNPFKEKGIKKTLARQIHFEAPPVSSAGVHLPDYLDDIIERMLAKNPLHRYGRAAQIIRDLNYRGHKNYPVETSATSAGYLPEVGQLIGRESEWQSIRGILDANKPTVILLVGAAGLGKSRLCQEALYYSQLHTIPLDIFDYDHALTAAELSQLRGKLAERDWSDGSLLIAIDPESATKLRDWVPSPHKWIELKPFGTNEVLDYLRHVTGIEDIPASLSKSLTQRCEGNPRLLREMLVACFSQHTFFDESGRWTPGAFSDLQQESEKLPLPSALGKWFGARTKTLSASALKALQVLAICEAPVDQFALESVAGPMTSWVLELTQGTWILKRGKKFTLRNPASGEWLLKQMTRTERSQLHDHVAKNSESFSEEDHDRHLSFGTEVDKILEACPRYTEQLRQQESWEEVLATLEWVWKTLPVSPQAIALGIRWIDALIELEQHEAVSDTIREVKGAISKLPQAEQPQSEQLLENSIIEWHLRRHDNEKARQHIKAALSADNARPPAQRLRLQNYLGRMALEAGDFQTAQKTFQSTWQEAQQLPQEERYTTANNDLGLTHLSQGNFDDAVRFFEEELKIIKTWQDPYLEARCHYNLAESFRGQGETGNARQHLQSAYDLAQGVGRHELTLRILNSLGNSADESEETEKAIDCYERGLRLAERLGDRQSSAALATNLGILFHKNQKNADARSHLALVEHLLRNGPQTPTEASSLARALLELALIEREEGDNEAAAEHLTAAQELASSDGAETLLPFIEEAQEELDMKPQQVNAWRDLLKINQQLAHVTDVPQLLQQILSHAVTLAHAEYGMVLLLDPNEELQVEAALNVEADDALKQMSRSMARQTIESGKPLLTDDAQLEDEFSANESVMMAQLRSVAVIPIHATGKVIGCLYLSHRYQSGVFSDVDTELLTAFADQAGIAIDRARLLERAKKKSERLEESLSERDEEISRLAVQVESGAATGKFRLKDLNSANPKMGKLFELIRKVGPTDLSIFIHGDTGTGKEVMARQLHGINPERSKGPFVAVSCGAIPNELIESELFGYKAGAFTGATRDKAGLFEAADGGTLFLDEIAELPMELQAKLLRVLQEREVQRLGETSTRKIDCRILSASHQDIKARIGQKTFREDLYYRLCQIQLDIPPLKARREDIPQLIEIFVARYCKQHKKKELTVARTLMRRLLAYDWPGNVRELENLILACCALSDGKQLKLEDIPPHHPLADAEISLSLPGTPTRTSDSTIAEAIKPSASASDILIDDHNSYDAAKTWRDYEQLIIAKAFEHHAFDARKTAESLGLSPAKVYKLVKSLDLKDPGNALYQEDFQYQENEQLKDYMVKIFQAARAAAGGKPYAAIRQLQVSPGFFYKTVPASQ